MIRDSRSRRSLWSRGLKAVKFEGHSNAWTAGESSAVSQKSVVLSLVYLEDTWKTRFRNLSVLSVVSDILVTARAVPKSCRSLMCRLKAFMEFNVN